MSKGIVKSTPIVTKPGTLSVTVADANPFKLAKGALLEFNSPAFTIHENDTVECEITSSTTCKVTKMLTAANPGS